MQQLIPFTARLRIAVGGEHRFTTDSILLSRFCAPKKNEKAAEFCCGSGAVSLLWFDDGNTSPKSVTGFEIDPDAVSLYNLTAATNGISERMCAVVGDLKDFEHIPQLTHAAFDLVAFNPPYFEKGFGEGARQTARQESAVSIEALCRAAAFSLRFGGRLCVCFKPERLPELFCALRQNSLEPKLIRPVLTRPNRPVHLMLVEAKLGAKPNLRWLPAWQLYDDEGKLTADYFQIYQMR